MKRRRRRSRRIERWRKADGNGMNRMEIGRKRNEVGGSVQRDDRMVEVGDNVEQGERLI